MRFTLVILLSAGCLIGCRHAPSTNQPKNSATGPAAPLSSAPRPAGPSPTAMPSSLLAGKVVSVNPKLRFVIIDFSRSRLPEIEQRFGVFRDGQKVGDVKISGPSQNTNIAADIVAGEAKIGDEVRLY